MSESEAYSNGLYAISIILSGALIGSGVGWNIIQKEAMPNGTWRKNRMWQFGLIVGALVGMGVHRVLAQISK